MCNVVEGYYFLETCGEECSAKNNSRWLLLRLVMLRKAKKEDTFVPMAILSHKCKPLKSDALKILDKIACHILDCKL